MHELANLQGTFHITQRKYGYLDGLKLIADKIANCQPTTELNIMTDLCSRLSWS